MLGRICPGCRRIYTGASCPGGCRPGGKRTTPRRARNQKVWASSAHKAQRIRVFTRDGFTCTDCRWHDDTETGKRLIADHIKGIDSVRAFADHELATRCRRCSGVKDGKRGRQATGRG